MFWNRPFVFSSSSGVVNIDNLEIITAPEDNTFDSRLTDINLSVMNDILASSNLIKIRMTYLLQVI